MKRHKVFAASHGPSTRSAGTPLALDPRALGVTFYVDEDGDCPVNDRCMGASLVRVCGPLAQRGGWWWDGYDAIAARFKAAIEDAETSSVVLVIDSPGGECAGLFECVRAMRALAASTDKRIVAYVDEGAYSAAYAIACVASEIYLPESGGVGSIGVIAELIDQVALNERIGLNVAVVSAGAHKADGHPDVPISDAAIEVVAARVAQLADQFYASVSESRPLDVEEVAALEAGCFYGADAVASGLADGVMGLAELLGSLAPNNEGAAAVPNEKEGSAMKRTGSLAAVAALASLATSSDVLSAPVIGATPASVIGAYKKTETSEVTEETESSDEDAGTTTTTTTTTTTESETTGSAEDDGEGEGEDEESDDDTEDASTEAAAPVIAPRASASTTRDVLAAVRRLTAQASPGAQIGALEALAANAARVTKLERQLAKATAATRKTSIAAKVDQAIRARLLTPAQRAWAIATGTKDESILDGYIANTRPVLAEPVQLAPADAPSASAPAVAGLTAAEASIAKKLHIDPAKLAAFKATGTVPTITH
jgi:ClpP class serine protease